VGALGSTGGATCGTGPLEGVTDGVGITAPWMGGGTATPACVGTAVVLGEATGRADAVALGRGAALGVGEAVGLGVEDGTTTDPLCGGDGPMRVSKVIS
jgi:hypothetical protein